MSGASSNLWLSSEGTRLPHSSELEMSVDGLVSLVWFFVDSLGLPLPLTDGLSIFPPLVSALAFFGFLLVSFSSGESSELDRGS